MKKIMKLNNKVKIMLFTVILLFLGTTGLFILYFSGNFKLLSTNSVIAYQCDDGWTKVGDGPTAYCQKFREYTYTCPKYTQKVGNGDSTYCQSCESTLYCPSGWQKVTGNGKPYCRKTETTYTCPKGYKKVGSGSSAYCNQVDYYTYSCPSGYTKVTGQGKPYCRKFFTYNYTCPYATKVGDGPTAYCLKHSGFEYTCPKGYTKIRGNGPPYCRAVLNYSYNCPSGYTKAGDGPSAYCFKGKGSSKKYASTIKKTNYTTKATTARKIYDVVKTTKIPQYFYSDSIATPHYKRVGAIPKLYNTTKDTEVKKNCTKTKATRHSAYSYESIKTLRENGTLSYTQSYTSGNATASSGVNYSEPDPSIAINFWKNKLNTNDFVYPKDSTTGKSLGAWPKNYKNYPAQLSGVRTYAGGYMWPITTTTGSYKFAYEHDGLDIGSKFGTPVYSPIDGTLVYSEWGHTANKGRDETSYSISIKSDKVVTYNGVKIDTVFLTHLSGIRYRCSENKCNRKVSQGELLGFSGTASGDAISIGWAPHLHITLYPSNNYNGGLYSRTMEKFYNISSGKYREVGR